MKAYIKIDKVWFDEDIIELSITVCDGTSVFSNSIYVGHDHLANLIKDLNIFRNQIHNGIYDIKFGEFGPEYANGAFKARLHFFKPGKLYISTQQETEYGEFKNNLVAGEAKMYLITELGLLDNFIENLKRLESGTTNEAIIETA